MYCQHAFDIRSNFPHHSPMYKDGSKNIDVSATAVICHEQYGICIPNQSSIFAAEAHALLLVLEHTADPIVFTDSKACLQAPDH